MQLILDYSTTDSRRGMYRRRCTRALIVLTCLAVIVAIGRWLYVPASELVLRQLCNHYLRQCLAFQTSDDMIVYEEDAGKAGLLLASRPRHGGRWFDIPSGDRPTTRIAAWRPDCLWRYLRASERKFFGREPGWCEDETAVVFMHERVSPSGERRLVVVRARPFRTGQGVPSLLADTYAIAPRTQAAINVNEGAGCAYTPVTGDETFTGTHPQYCPGPCPQGSLRIYAGQADPSDPSRLTFRCDVGSIRYVVEGRLSTSTFSSLACGNVPLDTVELVARREPALPCTEQASRILQQIAQTKE